jgi:hypothetical protein
LSLAFSGNKPRLAYHLRRSGPPAGDENQLWLSASDNGVTWSEPIRLQDGTANTFLYQSLALDAQGRAAVAANVLTNTGGACGGPKLARSSDLINWTMCSPDTFMQPDTGGAYVNLRFTSNGRLYMAFQYNGGNQLAKGIVLWRES